MVKCMSDLDEKIKELMNLDKEELAKRLAILQMQLEGIDTTTRFILNGMYKPVRLMKRDYRPIFGVLVGAIMEPVEFVVYRETADKEWNTNIVTHEKKYSRVKASSLIMWDIIEEQWKEEEKKEDKF